MIGVFRRFEPLQRLIVLEDERVRIEKPRCRRVEPIFHARLVSQLRHIGGDVNGLEGGDDVERLDERRALVGQIFAFQCDGIEAMDKIIDAPAPAIIVAVNGNVPPADDPMPELFFVARDAVSLFLYAALRAYFSVQRSSCPVSGGKTRRLSRAD